MQKHICIILGGVSIFINFLSSLYFVGDFNNTMIPLSLVGYHMIVANSALNACHWLTTVPLYHLIHGCHRSGNSQGKKKFFKVREKSGNFTLSQGKFTSLKKVREK